MGMLFYNYESRIAAMEANGTAYLLANSVQNASPAAGQTVVSNGAGFLALSPAGLLATLSVTFPAAPVDGQSFEIGSTQVVTTLTLNGGTVKGALTTIAVNGWARWKYVASASAWFRAS